MRRYWQPAALVDELAGNRPVKPVKLLGENLVLFRDDKGRYGLIERACPHRGTDLAYGRLENGGLRCAFHGWLFDVTGQCLRDAGRAGRLATSAPTSSRRPIRWWRRAASCSPTWGRASRRRSRTSTASSRRQTHTFAFKGMIDCNWLQSLEVGIDPAHTSFLHRFFHDEDPAQGYGKHVPRHNRSAPTCR